MPAHLVLALKSFSTDWKFYSGMWSACESVMSSLWRQLIVIFLTLKSFVGFVAGKKVKFFTDNQNVARIVHCC